MNNVKGIFKSGIIFLICVCIVLLTGCGGNISKKKKAYKIKGNFESGVVASNSDLELSWNNSSCCILLKNKKTGKIWSTTPYEYYSTGECDECLSSPIYIDYINDTSKLSDVSKAYKDSIKNGSVTSKQIENGIEVCYYFQKSKIAVPVQYVLRDDSLAISVDFTKIYEKENKLRSVSIAPYLTSVKNDTDNSYLFIPSGCGSIMRTYENVDGERSFSADVFSVDASKIVPEELNDESQVKIPVFGVKSGEDALCAIIEGNAQASEIKASAGDKLSGYSNVYVNFKARDYDIYETQLSWEYKDVTRVSEKVIDYTGTVCFYPLSGNDADYIGMARCYKNYLKVNKLLSTDLSDSTYAVNIIGGATVKELTCGIPHNSMAVSTTFSKANEIIKDLIVSCNSLPSVRLLGFGTSGISYGNVGGGFTFSVKFGGEKGYKTLENFCLDNNIPIFSDFELLYFRNSGNGFNSIMDVAKSASLHKVKKYNVNIDLRNYDKDSFYFLLSRKNLLKASKKLLSFALKQNLSGVSIESLSSTKYCDYSSPEYSGARKIQEDTVSIINSFKNKNISVAVSNANSYSAAIANSCFSVPVDNGDFSSLDESIPFYQMVFGADKSLFSKEINVSDDINKALMLAVQSGTKPSFVLIDKYNSKLDSLYYNGLYSSVYSSNKDYIIKSINKLDAYYKKINGASIKEYSLLENNVSKTVFDCNVTVYANHSSHEVSSPVGEISSYGYKIVDGGE